MHEIRHIAKHCLDTLDTTVADAKRLDQGDGVGPLECGLAVDAISGLVGIELVGVIKKSGGYHHAALDINQGIATFANAFVDAIDAEPKLCLAACHDGPGRPRCCSGSEDAVFQACAIVRKRRKHHAVVEFDRIEIAVGHSTQALARAPLARRQHLRKGRIVRHGLHVTKRQGQAGVAYHHGFNLGQPALAHRHPYAQIHRRAVFLGSTDPGRLTGLRIGGHHAGGRHARHRGPEPFGAKRHLNVVLGEANAARYPQRLGIALSQSSHIGIYMAGQARVVTVARIDSAVVAG